MTLYEREIRNFADQLEQDRAAAYRRYGFTMFHGLPDEDLVQERLHLRVGRVLPDDQYNLGVLANLAEDHAKAVEHYTAALQSGCMLPQLHFNLALSYERLGNNAEARKHYEKYMQMLRQKENISDEDREELSKLQSHMATL